MDPVRNERGGLDFCAFPGGYPLIYICADGGILCPKCANENKEVYLTSDDKTPEEKESRFDDPQWHIIAVDVYYEGASIPCDHCNEMIDSAYGDPEEDQS